jgi:YYY domain-containing protein
VKEQGPLSGSATEAPEPPPDSSQQPEKSPAPQIAEASPAQPPAAKHPLAAWLGLRTLAGRFARSPLAKLNWTLMALLVIVTGALLVRLYGLNWDDNQHQHPDERAIISTVVNFQWPHSWAEVFSASSPLSPHFGDGSHFFAYGTFPMYVLWQVAVFLTWLQHTFGFHWLPAGQAFTDYDPVTLVGRALSALFDTGTVLVTYFLGRRLGGKVVGVFAAACAAFLPFEVQLSHYFAVDTALTFFVALALLSCVAIAQEGKLRWVLLGGVASGLALASKFSALPLLLPLGVAYLLYWRQSDLRATLPRVFISLGSGMLSFVLAMPYALIDLKDFQAAIKEQGDLARGILDYPYTRQYAGTTPYLYELKNLLLYDLGVPLALLCFAGCVYVAWRLWRRWQDETLVLLAWVLVYFGITGSFYTKFSRYLLPIFPALCVFGALALVAFWRRRPLSSAILVAAKGVPPENGQRLTQPREAGSPRANGFPGRRPVAANLLAGRRIAQRLNAYLAWPSRRWLAGVLAMLVLGSSFVFTLALDNIYSQPMTRVAASRWLYAHVPSGNGQPIKTITYEIWDDSLPLNVDGHIAEYNFVGLPLYDDDTPQKADVLGKALAQADAVVIASNKLYPDSIPRLPERYPMTNRYYQLLFHGGLGFHLAAVFQNGPNLFGMYFDDSGADESYSVYDHPTVHIFLPNADRPDAAQITGLLMDGLTLPPPTNLTGTQKSLMLSPAQIADNQTMPPLATQFPADSFANQQPLLVWWLLLELLGLLVFPIVALFFRSFRDRGLAFAKTIGLLLLGYLLWLPASLRLLPYTNATVWGVFACVGLAGLAVGWLTRRDLLAFACQHWGRLLATELLFAVAFLFFVGIRALDPDLWHIWRGGEKPMELAFTNGILRSRYFPPLDPWFSGGYINYYYYGQFLMTVLMRLTGIAPTTAFNLAIPMLFGLLLTGGFSIVSHLTRQWWAGLLGGFFVALLGNLDGWHQLLAQWTAIQHGQPVPNFDYWASSRVIPFTINEFPFWSFLYADLHAHVIDLPIEILALGLAVAMLSDPIRRLKQAVKTLQGQAPPPGWAGAGRTAGLQSAGVGKVQVVGRVLLLGLAIGAMACINTWDVPTYALLVLLALVLREYTVKRRGWLLPYATIKRLLLTMVGIAACAYLFYLPFYVHFQSFVSGTGAVPQQDKLSDYTTLFGIWLFITASFFFVELYQWASARLTTRLIVGRGMRVNHPAYSALFWVLLAVAFAAYLVFYVVVGRLLPVLYGLVLLGLALFLVQGRGQRAAKQVTYLLLLSAIGVSILIETIYVRDFLDNSDWERMNTVFKFLEQVWVLYALGSALAVFELVRWLWHARLRARQQEYQAETLQMIEAGPLDAPAERGYAPALPGWVRGAWRPVWGLFGVRGRGYFPLAVRWAWSMGLVFLVLACSVFLVEGTQARLNDHAIWAQVQPPVNSPNYLPTLNGLAYMHAWYPGDYEAISWLNSHVSGSPVILEASCGPYQWYGRVSIYTGLPSVLGWDSHESQQRYGSEVSARVPDVQTIYATPDAAQAMTLLKNYQVRYVYLGQLERHVCGDANAPLLPPEALAKFETMVSNGWLRVVHQNADVTIYEVLP